MSNYIFDTHAHYDDEVFDDDRDKLLLGLKDKGVINIINVGTYIEASVKSISLTEQYDYIFAAVGIHPIYAYKAQGDYIGELKELSKNKKVVAIGEIGLDYHYEDNSPRDIQLDIFKNQILLAKELNKPVIIHNREASADTLSMIEEHKPKGALHCFSGSLEMALKLISLGMYIGIGGVVTFKNAVKLLEVVKSIPLEHMLLETDAPYLAPDPYRGKRCDSSMIEFSAKKISELKGISVEQVFSQTAENAKRLFLGNL